jgi:hypothetical protein
MTNQNPEELSKPTLKDIWYAIAKGTISIVPGYGATLSELISLLAISPATKRRDKWVNEQLTEAFRLIAEKVDISTFENLTANELFLTVVLQATSIALRNHQKEKLEALRNAIVNSVLPNAPDESLQQLFLNYVDIFTPYHLVLLNFIDNPLEWCQQHNVIVDIKLTTYVGRTDYTGSTTWEDFSGQVFVGIKHNSYLYEQAMNDLITRGLLKLTDHEEGSLHTPLQVSIRFLDLHKTVFSLSNAGKQFIGFIKSPPQIIPDNFS